jgi:hypothetical protein
MANATVLSEPQWRLLLDLLNREHRQLLVEIRHTDTHAYREELQKRLTLLESTIAQVRPLAGEPSGD